MNDTDGVNPAAMTEPTYPASPTPPPNTTGEYLVSMRRAQWPPDRSSTRRVFHTYAKATEYRNKLEAPERRPDAGPNDAVFVTIHWRACRTWQEIA